jgi:hypothetical protein
MSQLDEASILNLTVKSLHQAICRIAAGTLQAPGTTAVSQFRQVERLMRMAIALAGAGRAMPTVQVHGIPATGGPDALPELLTVKLTDLLAARASDHLAAALEGDPEALRAFDQEAERLIRTENIQLG